jgi:5'-nucleotidase
LRIFYVQQSISSTGHPKFPNRNVRAIELINAVPITILQTNDFHGTLSPDKARELARLRSACDLYFDCGDSIKTGNLGVPMKQEPIWAELDALRCTASVLGNRETHLIEAAFKAKIAGARHPVLCANLRRRSGGPTPLPAHIEIEAAGLRIGVVAVMVPMVTDRMVSKAASAYLWDPPIPTAIAWAEKLRPRVDLLIALTHIGHRQDQELARQAPQYDLILGGHSHTLLDPPERIGTTWICQTGSHGRRAGVYRWDGGLVESSLVPLP